MSPPEAPPSRARTRLRRSLWIALAILLLVGLEVLARQYVRPQNLDRLYREHPRRFWTLSVGDPFDGQIDSHIHVNALGLRGPEVEAQRPDLNVLLLGDSCTYGAGVRNGETLDAYLQKRLSEISGRNVRVWNGGCPGYSSYQGYDLLSQIGGALRPDVVVFAYMYGDAYRDIVPDNQRLGGPLAGRIRTLLWRSNVYMAMRQWLRGNEADYTDCLYRGSQATCHRVSLDDYRKNLQALVRLARKQGTKTVVFLRMPQRDDYLPPMQTTQPRAPGAPTERVPMPQPTGVNPPAAAPGEHRPPPPSDSHEAVLVEVGSQEGLLINGQDLWYGRPGRNALFWDILHFNEADCRVFADELAEAFVRAQIIGRKGM